MGYQRWACLMLCHKRDLPHVFNKLSIFQFLDPVISVNIMWHLFQIFRYHCMISILFISCHCAKPFVWKYCVLHEKHGNVRNADI
jgi:hypothetical protein